MTQPVPDLETDGDVRGRVVEGLRGTSYRLERMLGVGSQGTAALARPLRAGADGELVVVKFWRSSVLRQAAGLARLTLRKESVALGRLAEGPRPSPHVVRLLDQGELAREDGSTVPFLVLEHIDGGGRGVSLKDRVLNAVQASGKAFPPIRARRVLGGVAAGLHALHEASIIHRDLRPSNVLLTGWGDREVAKVADLGMSRPAGMFTTLGARVAVGAAGYAAPEQHRAGQMAEASDVFSFGAVMYFVLTGADMFPGSWANALAAIHAGQWLPIAEQANTHPLWRRSGILPTLEQVLVRAVKKDRKARHPSILALWQDLDPLLARAEAAEAAEAVEAVNAVDAVDAFEVRAPALRCVAEGAQPGEKLGVGAEGLFRMRGGTWERMPPPRGLEPSRLWAIAAVGRGRWLGGGDDGVVVFTEDACEIRQALSEPGMRITAVGGRSVRSFAAGGAAEGRASVLFAFHDGRWAAPQRLAAGLSVVSLDAVDAEPGAVVYDVGCVGADGRVVRLRWLVMAGRVVG